jgi:hypothetical protein
LNWQWFLHNRPEKSLSLSFSLDEKETKNQGKKMLPPAGLGLARFFADPTHIANGIIIFIVYRFFF